MATDFKRVAVSGLISVLLGWWLASHPVRAAEPPPTVLDFLVLRDGQPFGRHTIRIRRLGDRVEVENTASASVMLGPFTLFTYAYRSHEVWENGRLRSLAAWTNDDGKEVTVKAEVVAGGLRVSGPEGETLLPAGLLPTSFWTVAATRPPALLDTQTGQVARVSTILVGIEPADPPLTPGPVERYRMTGDLSSDLWYDAQGLLAKARFRARGALFEYVRAPPPTPTQRLAGERVESGS